METEKPEVDARWGGAIRGRTWASGSVCRGTTHLNLQYVYGLRLPESDGLRRQRSDQGPVWRGRKVISALPLLSKFPHPRAEAKAWTLESSQTGLPSGPGQSLAI